MSVDSAATPVTVPTGDGEMPAYRFDPARPGPAIVLLQEIFGVTPYIRSRAADLAALGYVVIVPEIYWRLDGVEIDESSDQVLAQAMDALHRVDWERAVEDAAATVRFAQQLPGDGRVGLVGFCFGGGLAFNAAAVHRPEVLVSYYGSALPDLLDLAGQVDVPALHHFGEADEYIPMETVTRIRDAVTVHDGVEFHTYPGANHAFDGPMPALHHEEAAQLAWTRTVEFLRRVLPAD
jgi:carboxymethylenebutenolidase